MNKKEKIEEILTRGVENIYPNKDFLKNLLYSNKKLSIYLGIDPTGPNLHLGHAIQLEKMRQFQKLGHKIIILIGDFTAMIGDPTDKNAARKPLTSKQVLLNSKDYKKQINKILKKYTIKYNSRWFNKMNFKDVLNLSSNFTIQQLLERDMFDKRIKEGKPINLNELMYPVMQGYDSVTMKINGEVGGNDQTFNMLVGRTLMKSLYKKEKFVLTLKLLVDSQGKKMGKTMNNIISLNENSNEMFGKIMSWKDDMIIKGFELCTKIPIKKINKFNEDYKNGKNPRDLKVILAKEIVSMYYSKKEANRVEKEFIKIFRKKGTPKYIKKYNIKTKKINPIKLITKINFSSSNSEAKRLIDGGGVKINNKKIISWKEDLKIKPGDIIQVGKRKFGKIK